MLSLLQGLKKLNSIYKIDLIGLQFPNPKTHQGQVPWTLLLRVSFQNKMKKSLNINIKSNLMKDLRIQDRLINYVFKGIRKKNQSGGKLLWLQQISFIIHNFKQLVLTTNSDLYPIYKTVYVKVKKLANRFHQKTGINSSVLMKSIDLCTTNKINYKHY